MQKQGTKTMANSTSFIEALKSVKRTPAADSEPVSGDQSTQPAQGEKRAPQSVRSMPNVFAPADLLPTGRGRRREMNKADFRPFSTNMSESVKTAVEKELFKQRFEEGKRQTFSELLDELLRGWLAQRGVNPERERERVIS
jgi:hypothetical protein